MSSLMVMIEVSVRFLARFRELLGLQGLQVRVQVGNVRSLLGALCAELGETFVNAVYDPISGELRSDVLIMVNGRNMLAIEGLETKLGEGDVVVLLTPVGGGHFTRDETG
jgi:molybdopterin synthase sulfur carrier subunit